MSVLSTGCVFSLFGSGRTLQLRRVDPVEHYAASTEELDARELEAVNATVAGGDYTVYGSDPRPPFHEVEYVEHGGVYYSVGTVETEPGTSTRHVLRAERVNDTASEETVRPEAYGDDRGSVVRAYRRSTLRGSERDTTVRDAVPVRAPENRTALLPEPEHRYVNVSGDVYRLSVEERELEERGFVVTAERAAGSDAELRRVIDAEHTVSLDPDEQRRVLDTASETGSYTESSAGSDALDGVLDRLGGNDLLKYDGGYYDWNVAGP